MKGKPINPTQLDNFVLGKDFNGYIADLNIFDSFLDHETMAMWTSCRSKLRGNIFAWNPQLLNLTSPKDSIQIRLEAVKTVDFCEVKKNHTYHIFYDENNLVNQYEARSICRKINAKLADPQVDF